MFTVENDAKTFIAPPSEELFKSLIVVFTMLMLPPDTGMKMNPPPAFPPFIKSRLTSVSVAESVTVNILSLSPSSITVPLSSALIVMSFETVMLFTV